MSDSFTDEEKEKTFSELVEDNDIDGDVEEFVEEFAQQREDFRELVEIFSTTHILAEMFKEDYITLGTYIALTDYLMEREADLDLSLM